MSAYCPCPACCGEWADGITASMRPAREGVTVAADRSRYPFGTCLEIEGVGRRIVQDIGGAIKGRRLDVYFASHEAALEFGRRELRVRGCES